MAVNVMVLAWKGIDGDATIWSSAWSDLPELGGTPGSPAWLPPTRVRSGAATTSHGPALAADGVIGAATAPVHMVWRGDADQRITSATLDPPQWSAPGTPGTRNGPFLTSERPAVAILKNRAQDVVVLAWRSTADSSLWWSIQNRSAGAAWSDPQPVRGGAFGTTHGPALAAMADRVIMVWKGRDADSRLFWASFDGTSWSDQEPIRQGAFGANATPALVATERAGVHLAWRGRDDDKRVFLARFDGRQWSDQAPVHVAHGGVLTSHGPGMALAANGMNLVWKDQSGDQIWWSVQANWTGGGPWSDPQIVRPDTRTSHGPALASLSLFSL